jgi:orotidine-5'-phosphate decarboxylase
VAEVILALDLPTPDAAWRVVDALPQLRWVKLGPVLFIQDGPHLIRALKGRGLRVFLDLKWHDIPNTVAVAAGVAAAHGVDLATVHALGGSTMVRAAVEAAGPMRIAAVSVLTSHGPEEYWRAVGRADGYAGARAGGPVERAGAHELTQEVVRLATLAVEAGARAIVAPPAHVTAIAPIVGPDGWVVTPGIRPAGSPVDDHSRALDPATAVRAGATHLVVGRPILRADHPATVYQELVRSAT